MSETIIGCCITAGGVLLGTIISIVGNYFVSRFNSQVEKKNTAITNLVNQVVSYSRIETEYLTRLKEWTNEYKKDIKSDVRTKILGENYEEPMSEHEAKRIYESFFK